ncbi:TRAP transporter small permease [Halomonas urumqiensis]|uniref:TRAP transporter small permease protein n=1 Tax=Halomonas urumqiensis TaxID=1684789 RepID=A0A2N7UMI9_9GAMM|nr:TRAP transporter small permease [Halomonas urumqiensis]PMR81622.1 TRAP transporter small permease [Halomonas urumqiensis]PTB02259.1 TRAP transporter small permease [Halomonas urumqiensis]GHE21726.1 C4-dicarboxylate ABC transporter permease [Halomonas urumqiensis]
MKFLLREAEKIVCAALFLGMTLLGFANVVVRYGTNYSLAATEELLTNGFLILTVFGAAIAARRGEHLAVTLLYDVLPKALRWVVFVISGALSILLLALSAYFSLEVLMNQLNSGMRSYGLGLPAWYYQVAVPFGFALIIVRYLQRLVEEARKGRAVERAIPDV